MCQHQGPHSGLEWKKASLPKWCGSCVKGRLAGSWTAPIRAPIAPPPLAHPTELAVQPQLNPFPSLGLCVLTTVSISDKQH